MALISQVTAAGDRSLALKLARQARQTSKKLQGIRAFPQIVIDASRPQSPNWQYSSRASVPHYDWWAAGDVVEGSLCGQCPSAVACPHFWKRLLSLQRHTRSPCGGTYLHPWAILQARIFLASARYEMAFPDEGLQVNYWGLCKPTGPQTRSR